ncbi:uncharacterized protein LOC122851000 [Aphidius gifuensis]|uniref:uncharacterized protein LOC122851000 n=1 Tax=Aphidius gifuensis TaxID=684658 RepID=UPI001CDC0677|nr:uncharacterized protein LOC122851000 [Aphidius gifuensis]
MINGVCFLKKIYCYPWLGLSGFFMLVHFGTVIIKFIYMIFNSCPIPINSFLEIISIWVLEIYLIGSVYNYSQKLNKQMENTLRLTNGNNQRNNSSIETINTLETNISSYDNFGVAINDPENRHSVKLNPVRMMSFDITN